MTVNDYNFKKYSTCFKENYYSLKLFWIFSFKIDSITLRYPGSGSKLAKILDPGSKSSQNPKSGSKFKVFGSTTVVATMYPTPQKLQYVKNLKFATKSLSDIQYELIIDGR